MTRPFYAPDAETLFNSLANGFKNFTAASTSSNPVDLSATTDVLLTITVPPGALTGTTPTLTVQLDDVDPAGNRSRRW